MSFANAARQLDALLRGGYTRRDDLEAGRLELPVRTLTVSSLALGAFYGVFMGLFAVLRPNNPSFAQLCATTLKVPLLFLATLFVTFPSLYVFSALSRSRLEPAATLKLLLAAVAVNLTVLASFGPVTGFFTLSTDSYPFMVLLSVVFFLVSGGIGLAFLARTLDHVFQTEDEAQRAGLDEAEVPRQESETAPEQPAEDRPPPAAGPDSSGPDPSGAARLSSRPGSASATPYSAMVRAPARPGRNVLRSWVVIYAIVGAQMGWILRPFIGAPNQEFSFFRERGGNFVKAILKALSELGG